MPPNHGLATKHQEGRPGADRSTRHRMKLVVVASTVSKMRASGSESTHKPDVTLSPSPRGNGQRPTIAY
jgi:hypothetical protein